MYWPYFAPDAHQNSDYDEKLEVITLLESQDYSKKAMYSPIPKYKDFKTERMEYPGMTSRVYHMIVLKMTENFKFNEKVRSIRAQMGVEWAEHYGIRRGTPIGVEHLCSLIIYCDYTQICTAFSETFRQINPEEKLESVKKRNTKYWWLSKNLREAVEVFGETRYGDWSSQSQTNHYISGPFYCGVSFVAIVSSFCTSLRGPVSTSKELLVAMTFADNKGIIMEMDNRESPGYWQKWFNTTWISAYKEENERLTIGGHSRVQIVSIRIESEHLNFETIIYPLYWFDLFFCFAGELNNHPNPFNEEDIGTIHRLMNYADSNDRDSTGFPQYILDVFDHWRFSKKRIEIMHIKFDEKGYNVPPTMFHLFFQFLSRAESANGIMFTLLRCNLLTHRILNLFPGLAYIKVDAAGYPFSLSLFLDVLSGLDYVRSGNFQCDIEGQWLEEEFRKVSGYSGIFRLSWLEPEHKEGYHILQIMI